MTDFDHELIAALAEGTLPADEAADLEARIAADPAASAELDAQRVALAAIAAATPPRLDDFERRRLHASVAADLDLVLPERAARPARRRWSVNWSALATAAAVLLGVALAAPLLSLLNTSGSSDATTTVADAGDGELQSQALDAPAETIPQAEGLEQAAAPAEDEPPATEAPPETMVATTTAAAADTDSVARFGPLGDFGPLDAELTQVRARLLSTDELFDRAADDAAESPPCVEELRQSLVGEGAAETTTVTLLGTGTFEGAPVYVLAVSDGDVLRELSAVDTGDCTQVAAATIE